VKRPGAVELGDLPKMSEVVRSPLAEHLMEGDIAELGVRRVAITRICRDAPQQNHCRPPGLDEKRQIIGC
jgi:hypothetical protein